MKQNIEIISLVFKSVEYTRLICEQLKSENCLLDGWDVGVRLVLNDATDEVIEEVRKLDINYTIYNDRNITEFWCNRMYRCYNYAAKTSEYDNVCFVNSDMIFSRGWLKNLLKYHNGKYIPCSRLVESGKLRSAKLVITKDFGRHPNNINYEGFAKFAEEVTQNSIHSGGLFMPCVFNKKRFFEFGMYPEGDAPNSGDRQFFTHVENSFGVKHITVFDSIVYHIQTGERDE